MKINEISVLFKFHMYNWFTLKISKKINGIYKIIK